MFQTTNQIGLNSNAQRPWYLYVLAYASHPKWGTPVISAQGHRKKKGFRTALLGLLHTSWCIKCTHTHTIFGRYYWFLEWMRRTLSHPRILGWCNAPPRCMSQLPFCICLTTRQKESHTTWKMFLGELQLRGPLERFRGWQSALALVSSEIESHTCTERIIPTLLPTQWFVTQREKK